MSYWRGIFVSYRRQDTQDLAGRLTTSLSHRFGPWRVFRDHEGIEAGQDWLQTYRAALARSRVVLVVIGPDWNPPDANDPSRRRLDNDDDHVRGEVAAALLQPDTRVVPVLVEGASLPSAEELPDNLDALRACDAVRLDDDSFVGDFRALASDLPLWSLRRLSSALLALVVLGGGFGWLLRPAPTFDGVRDVVLAETALVGLDGVENVSDVSAEIAKGLVQVLDSGGGISVHGADEAEIAVGVSDPVAAEQAAELWDRGAEVIVATELRAADGAATSLQIDTSLWLAPFSGDLLDDLSGSYRSLSIQRVDPSEPSSLDSVRSEIEDSAVTLRELLLGLSHLRLGEYTDARDRLLVGLDFVSRAAAADSLAAVFQFFLGVTEAYQDPSSPTALEWFELASESDPGWARPMLGLADITFRRSNGTACLSGVDEGGLERTAARLDEAERLMLAQPGPREALASGLRLGRGRLLLCREFAGLDTDYGSAIGHLQAVAEDGESSEFGPTRAALALELLGLDSYRLGEFEVAVQRFDRARTLTKLPAARCRNTEYLIDTRLRLGRPDEARANLDSVRRCLADGHTTQENLDVLSDRIDEGQS